MNDSMRTAQPSPPETSDKAVCQPVVPRACLSASSELREMKVPAYYSELVDWSDAQDPLCRQVLPSPNELNHHPSELADPIGDLRFQPVPRLTHRHPDRVLLYPTYDCAVACRFCFRKELLREANGGFAPEELEPALQYVAERDHLCEVILSGGDPLMVGNEGLAWLRDRLQACRHLRLLRIHTRIPAVQPSRVTPDLVNALRGRLMVCVVTHFNHPNEITPAAQEACRLLREGGFMLLNQTVLLKGVNDNPEVLIALLRGLTYDLGAKPYYLHHCDLTRGLRHFRTTVDDGLQLMHQLRGRVSGLCVPCYVLDLPGGRGKVPLGPSYLDGREGQRWRFRAHAGEPQVYDEVVENDRTSPPEPPLPGELPAAAAEGRCSARTQLIDGEQHL
ncbi:KamA family radical SAM protein [Myxococcota bacterium]